MPIPTIEAAQFSAAVDRHLDTLAANTGVVADASSRPGSPAVGREQISVLRCDVDAKFNGQMRSRRMTRARAYGRFTEGFDTTILTNAKVRLDQLA